MTTVPLQYQQRDVVRHDNRIPSGMQHYIDDCHRLVIVIRHGIEVVPSEHDARDRTGGGAVGGRHGDVGSDERAAAEVLRIVLERRRVGISRFRRLFCIHH